jgi:putative SOS response-associated peptidase YedK
MCGRYSLVKDKIAIEKYFHQQLGAMYRGPSYNISPSQTEPILTANGFEDMRWGLVPQWAKSLNTGFTMINARSDTLMEKNTYKRLVPDHRCIIPASGFYEWLPTSPKEKVPYYFHLKGREVFGFAGLWTSRKDSEGVEMKSFTIITVDANEVVSPIHDRMPAILTQEDEKVWLNADLADPADVLGVLQPYDPAGMEAYPVSSAVSSAKNNGPELIEPREDS